MVAHAREIQRPLPSTRSSCSSQADIPANTRPTAERGFIATGPGRTGLKAPASSAHPARTTQPTSMATMLEARENVLRKVTRPGMESPPSPGRPAASFPCLAISYSRYRLSPTKTGGIVLYGATLLTEVAFQLVRPSISAALSQACGMCVITSAV